MRKPTNSIQAPMQTELVATTTSTSTGALVGTSSSYNIKNGEVAILASDIDAADYGQLVTAPAGKTVRLVQGTPKSATIQAADPWGVGDPDIVKSSVIYPKKVRKMVSTNYSSGSYAAVAWKPSATIAVDEKYGFISTLDGVRQKREYGDNLDQPSAVYETGDALSAYPMDEVLQHLVDDFNSQSAAAVGNRPVVALGLKSDGFLADGVTATGGTALSSLTNDGSTVEFLTKDGVTYTLAVTTELVRALAGVIAAHDDVSGASTIEVVDITTAGAEEHVDIVLLVGLDGPKAAYQDDLIEVRTDVDINPTDAFEGDGVAAKSYAQEPKNDGRTVSILSNERAQLDVHTMQNAQWGNDFSRGYSYIDKSKNYGSFIVEYYDTEDTVDHNYVYEKKATVYWEQTEPNTLTVATIGAFTPSETAPAAVANFKTWVEAND